MKWMDEDLAERKCSGLLRKRSSLQSAQGVHVRWRGRDLLNFACNDYLNLAADQRLARAAARAASRYGSGAGASPLVAGYLPPLRNLERELAAWEGTEAALVFSSGFAANLAAVGALAEREDAIFSDALNHASLVDGCRLARCPVHVYRHADVDHLEDLLRSAGRKARRRLIATDTVFSMDGDLAPVKELIKLAERYDCMLLIDEAHATGVLGEQGRGATDLLPQGVKPDPNRLIKVGTLSKALGSQGGFVCGSRRLIEWLVNHARPYIFSTALAPSCAAAAHRALRIVRDEPERRWRLQGLAALLREQLVTNGMDIGPSQTQIVPFVVGSARAVVRLAAALRRQGLSVPPIRPPSVPEGTARLRISVTAGHGEEDVHRLVAALRANMCHIASKNTPWSTLPR
jgi:8-amino-7-oxononanoate synthase